MACAGEQLTSRAHRRPQPELTANSNPRPSEDQPVLRMPGCHRGGMGDRPVGIAASQTRPKAVWGPVTLLLAGRDCCRRMQSGAAGIAETDGSSSLENRS